MPGIAAVFFDLGDTLVDLGEGRGEYEALVVQRAEKVYGGLSRLGAVLGEQRAFCSALAEYTERSYQRALAAQAGIGLRAVMLDFFATWGISPREELVEAAVREYCGGGESVRPLRRGALEVLEKLSADGLRLGIISNTIQPARMMDQSLARRRILDYFGARVYSSEHPWAKPHPAIFRLAMEALDVAAAESVHVGDRLDADVQGAQSAGMMAVHISVAHRSEDGSRVKPDARIDELPELLGALSRLGTTDQRHRDAGGRSE